MKTLYSSMAISTLSETDILGAIDWYDKLAIIDPKIQELSLLVIEFDITVSLSTSLPHLSLKTSSAPTIRWHRRSCVGAPNQHATSHPRYHQRAKR